MRKLLAVLIGAASLIVIAAEKEDLKATYQGKSFFLQHNLRFQGETVHWANFVAQGDYVAIGTSVTVMKLGREAVLLRPEGWKENLEWISKTAVRTRPPSSAGFSAPSAPSSTT